MVSSGCAFLTFVHKQSAIDAVENLHDRVRLPNAMNALQVRLAETPLDRENKLFVGMLPKTFSEMELQVMFEGFGELKEVHIIRGPEGSPKGCAFVKFVTKEAAMLAIDALHETIPHGATRPLVVKLADNKKSSFGPSMNTGMGMGGMGIHGNRRSDQNFAAFAQSRHSQDFWYMSGGDASLAQNNANIETDEARKLKSSASLESGGSDYAFKNAGNNSLGQNQNKAQNQTKGGGGGVGEGLRMPLGPYDEALPHSKSGLYNNRDQIPGKSNIRAGLPLGFDLALGSDSPGALHPINQMMSMHSMGQRDYLDRDSSSLGGDSNVNSMGSHMRPPEGADRSKHRSHVHFHSLID
jgi:hypothetical protein